MARKSGLGKGLDALIPGNLPSQPEEGGITYVPVTKIFPNPHQPRFEIKEDDLQELAISIKEHGILQPLIVTQGTQSDQYALIAGERRWRAAKLAGVDTVPVLIRQATDQQMLELALIENLQRSDLTPLETAEAYKQLIEDFSLTHEDVAMRVGKSRVTVTNTLRLLDLPEAVQQALADGKITEGHARALLGLNYSQAQVAALQTVLKQDLTVRQTEQLVRKLAGEKPARVINKGKEPEILALEERLRNRLGTKVTLQHGKKGGNITIHYYSDEELESLISQILQE